MCLLFDSVSNTYLVSSPHSVECERATLETQEALNPRDRYRWSASRLVLYRCRYALFWPLPRSAPSKYDMTHSLMIHLRWSSCRTEPCPDDLGACDAHTHSLATDLHLRGIHTTQSGSHTLSFERERDVTMARLIISGLAGCRELNNSL